MTQKLVKYTVAVFSISTLQKLLRQKRDYLSDIPLYWPAGVATSSATTVRLRGKSKLTHSRLRKLYGCAAYRCRRSAARTFAWRG